MSSNQAVPFAFLRRRNTSMVLTGFATSKTCSAYSQACVPARKEAICPQSGVPSA